MIQTEQFFETARERYKIKLAREAGKSKPWTDDKVLQTWRFCNVHREDDKTTTWFRDNIRSPLSTWGSAEKIVRATVIFRWFNRIETGEKIQDLLLGDWDTEEARRRLKNMSPVVTGAYIIKGPDGYSKLDGVLFCIDRALPMLKSFTPNWGPSLEGAWDDLLTVYYLGRFMAYELVSDLRWTPVLESAGDIDTWANAGPGCARGLGWVEQGYPGFYNPGSSRDQAVMLAKMQELLSLSKSENFWPQHWQAWEMREVEHWNCEYDKICRARSGQKLKRRYA